MKNEEIAQTLMVTHSLLQDAQQAIVIGITELHPSTVQDNFCKITMGKIKKFLTDTTEDNFWGVLREYIGDQEDWKEVAVIRRKKIKKLEERLANAQALNDAIFKHLLNKRTLDAINSCRARNSEEAELIRQFHETLQRFQPLKEEDKE